MANRNKAKKMASAGATARDIRKTTGVRGSAARKMVENRRPAPAPVTQTPTTQVTQQAPALKSNLFIDPTPYLRGGNLTGDSFAQAVRESNAGNLNMRNFADSALGFGLKNPNALDPSGRQALQDYYNSDPQSAVGLQSMQTAMGAGLGEQDFVNRLTNFRNNYTFSNFGPGLRDRMSGKVNPIQAQVDTPQQAGETQPTESSFEPKTLGQGLRIAGGNYGIGRKELNSLVTGGKEGKVMNSPDKLIRRLDKINEKRIGEGKTGISLKSGAANKLIKQFSKISKFTPFGRSQFDLGTGRLGMQIQSMLGDTGSPGYMRQGQRVGARDAVDPTYLGGGVDLDPKGREVNRGIGKQYEVPKRLLGGSTTPAEDATTVNTSGTGGTVGTVGTGGNGGSGVITGSSPSPTSPAPANTTISSGLGGDALSSWATNFRRSRSSRQKAGKGAQGLASQKKSPFKSWY